MLPFREDPLTRMPLNFLPRRGIARYYLYASFCIIHFYYEIVHTHKEKIIIQLLLYNRGTFDGFPNFYYSPLCFVCTLRIF